MRILGSLINFVKVSIRSKRSALFAIAITIMMAILASVSVFVASRSSAHGAPPAKKQQQGCCSDQPTTQVLYAPTTGLPGAGRAELVLNNNRQGDLAVTPTIYTKDGRPAVCDQITLKSMEVRRIPVAELVKGFVHGVGNTGGISLSYFGGLRELRSQIALFGEGRAGSVDIPVTAATDFKSTVKEAVWWSPDGATATLALANASDKLILVRLVFGNGTKGEILIGPFATETVTYKNHISTPSGAAESARLEHSGAIGALRAAGYVRSADKKYTSMIRFYDPQTVRQPNLYATNLKLKNSIPHVVLKNISNEPITATPRFLPLEGEAGNPLELPPVSLAAQEAREIDLAPLLEAAAERDDFDIVSVQVSNNGATASLIGALCSIDKASSITYEAPLRDSGPRRRSTGTYPWKVDGDYSTLITITNTGQKQAALATVISYEGGQYVAGLQRIEAGATAVFDLNKIQREQIPDENGQTIPHSVTEGQFVWSVIRSKENKLIGRMQLVSKANRASMSYSCELCCPWSHDSARISPESVNVFVGQGVGVEAQERFYINCNGQFWLTPWQFATFANGEWRSGDESIATVGDIFSVFTNVIGVAGGTTYVEASWESEIWFFSTSIDDCEMIPTFAFANANVNVQAPTVTVNEVGFRNDFQITKWSSGAVIDNPDGSTPTWTSGGVNDPVAYEAFGLPRMFATFGVTSPQSVQANIRVRLAGGGVIAQKNGVELSGGSLRVDNIDVSSVLANTVGKSTPTFTWEISYAAFVWNPIGNSGPHTMFWTYNDPISPPFSNFGFPYSGLYDEALERACGYANGLPGNEDLIRNAINFGLQGDIFYNPAADVAGHPLNVFNAPAGAQCVNNADLLRGLLRSIGINGDVVFIWAGSSSEKLQYKIGSTGHNFPTFRIIRPLEDEAPTNPHFRFHAVVSRGGTGGLWWDPSYGLSYSTLPFDETAFNATPQQISLSFPGPTIISTFTCPH